MKRNVNPWDQITMCHKDFCLKATGRYAEIISIALVGGLVLAAVAFLQND